MLNRPGRWRLASSSCASPDTVVLDPPREGADRAHLEAAIRAAHPYELPEIVAVPAARGLPDYLAWVAAETAPDKTATC